MRDDVRSFIAAAPESLRAELAALGDLDQRLEALRATASGLVPEIEGEARGAGDASPKGERAIDGTGFARWLAARLDTSRSAAEALDALRVADLAVAFGARSGVRPAIAALEAGALRAAGEALRGMRIPTQVADDVLAALREQLLMPRGDRGPLLDDYRGAGDLRNWVKISAVRAALRAVRRSDAVSDEPSEILGVPGPGEDPGIAALRVRFGEAFREAFAAAIASLDPADRLLLRQHHLDGLTLDELARTRRVHRATVARKLAAAREAILSDVRGRLRDHFGISVAECESLVRLARSRLDVSISVLLAPVSPAKPRR